jgi:hypothetical protein
MGSLMEIVKAISPQELEEKSSKYAYKLCGFLEDLNKKQREELQKSGVEPMDLIIPLDTLRSVFMLSMADTLCQQFVLMLDE